MQHCSEDFLPATVRLLAMLLDQQKFEQVGNVCLCLEGAKGLIV